MNWQIITGEYPPQSGGVGDYTRILADGLATAGDEVHVWAPGAAPMTEGSDGVQVHRLSDHFGPRAMLQLNRALSENSESRVLIQYVPQAFGWKGMNLPFCWWIYSRRQQRPIVMFHEVMFPLDRAGSFKHNLLGTASRAMASLVSRAAVRVFVSTPIWAEVLRARCGFEGEAVWLPLSSNIPLLHDEAAVLAVRRRCNAANSILIGHFSSYPEAIRSQLGRVLSNALGSRPEISILLLGRDSKSFRTSLIARCPDFCDRIFATGPLSSAAVSHHLSACDLMLQLYPDGACTRRTTLIATLAHGRPVLTTLGRATESIWQENRAIAFTPNDDASIAQQLDNLIAAPSLRKSYAEAAAALYRERFDLRHGIGLLRAAGCELQ